MHFYVYNCPNDRHCLVLVCEKHRLNENVIYVSVNMKTFQRIKISLSPGKLKKINLMFFLSLCLRGTACVAPPLYL